MSYLDVYYGLQKEASMKKQATLQLARLIKVAKLMKEAAPGDYVYNEDENAFAPMNKELGRYARSAVNNTIGAGRMVGDIASAVGRTIKNQANMYGTQVADAAKGTAQALGDAARGYGNAALMQGQLGINTAKRGINNAVSAIGRAGSWLGNKVKNYGNAAVNMASDIGSAVGQTARNYGNMAQQTAQRLGRDAGQTASALGQAARGYGNAALMQGQLGANAVKRYSNDMADAASQAVRGGLAARQQQNALEEQRQRNSQNAMGSIGQAVRKGTSKEALRAQMNALRNANKPSWIFG